MATIVNNPSGGPSERVIDRTDSGAGWAVALVVLIAVIVGLFVWYRYRVTPGVPSTGTENVNVTVPASGGGGGTGGNTGGSTGGGTTGGSGGTTGGSGGSSY